MKHLFTIAANGFSSYTRHAVLLLALGAAGPAAWGQSFGPVSVYSTGPNSAPEGLAVGDVNGDGQLDIVTGNTGTSQVAVLLGQATGAFAAPLFYASGSIGATWEIDLADLNNDGRLDIIVPCNTPQSFIGVLYGLAGGGFAPVTTYSTGAGNVPRNTVVADVDKDGLLDIAAVINGNAHGVAVLFGQASGGFAASKMYSTGAASFPSGIAAGDVNGDTKLDLVVTLQGSDAVAVLPGLPGGFGPAIQYATGSQNMPFSVTLGDLNNDGRTDIVSSLGFSDMVGVFLGQTSGGVSAMAACAAGSGPLQVALSDVNGDGRLDILTAHFNANTVGVLLGQAAGFAPMTTFLSGPPPASTANVVAADINRDGRLDLVTANVSSNSVGVLLNTGTFTPLATVGLTAADIMLSPNPAQGAFTVQLPTAVGTLTSAELLNALGQVVRRPIAAAPRFTVQTAGLAPGVYTLHLTAGPATIAKRVLIE